MIITSRHPKSGYLPCDLLCGDPIVLWGDHSFMKLMLFRLFPVLMVLVLMALGCRRGPAPGSASVVPGRSRDTVRFEVSGMHCAGCSGGLRSELLRVPGVYSAKVDHRSGKAVVVCDLKRVESSALVKAIEEAGYTAREMSR